jgi:RHS repeat-associated protein
VVDSNDNVKETINYYPFGSEMRMQDPAQMAGDTWQPYRFTGKELDKQNGLNMYDFGARLFDVAGVPMWTSVDPLAEKYYNVSPYSYCAGDPVNKFDPDGNRVIPIHRTSAGTNTYNSPSHFRQAMIAFGKTSFGHQLLSDFTPKGSTIFGVKGNGRYANYDLNIYEFDFTEPGEQSAMLYDGESRVNAQTQLNSSKDGKPRFDVIFDVQRETNDLIETICHEFCIHLSNYSEIIEGYKGSYNFSDAQKIWEGETETQQHSDMIKGKHGKLKGTQNYNKISEELFRTRPSLIKTFERKNEDYEKEYK